ncbi:hypothetical protein yinte0001_32780 [Yersinia intermedia ATCC 29909]|nr:hypothetical protein yinte0001_32780 [Yersinia intermedia ATCC 29909]
MDRVKWLKSVIRVIKSGQQTCSLKGNGDKGIYLEAYGVTAHI